MKLRYDLHLHSCLSPCGDEDMTPNNIVNMAKLLGYDVIALTDHNSVKNCPAAVQAGEREGLTVIAGMELCTAEEIHIVCLFPLLEKALEFGDAVEKMLPPVKNRPEIFGGQVVMDAEDKRIGVEETLLVNASFISVEEVVAVVDGYCGVCFPAHVDRASYSILANLGTIPPDLGFGCAEISMQGDSQPLLAQQPILGELLLLQSSDAHRLEDMPDSKRTFELPCNSAQAVIDYLKNPLSLNVKTTAP